LTISFDTAEKLQAAGFTQWEIGKFAEGKTPDGHDQPMIALNNPLWKRVLKSRKEWMDDKIEKNWTKEEIERATMSYYAKIRGRSPWDFLKAEYYSPARKDYYAYIRARSQRRIEAVLGKY